MTPEHKADGCSRKSLVVTTSTLPIFEGDGVPRFVLDLSIAMSDHFEVTVLAPDAPGAVRTQEIDKVHVRRFRYLWPRRLQTLTDGGVISVNLRRGWRWLQIPFLLVAQTCATVSVARRVRPVAVNAHWLIPQGMTSALACAVTRTRLVLHVHAGDVYLLRRLPLGGWLARFVVGRSAAVLADGSHVRDALDDLIGCPSGAHLRPMGVWTGRFSRPHGVRGQPALIVFVGRLVEKKGLRYLIEAMPEVRASCAGAELDIIGDGPLSEELRGQVDALGLSDAIRFVGPLPHADVVEHLHAATVACVPSIIDSRGETEGMPTVVLEAMAAGLRVVGSNVDGIPDILRHRENGWLAQPGDSVDLAQQLLSAIDGRSADEVVRSAADTARQHDWEAVASEYAAIVRAAVKSG